MSKSKLRTFALAMLVILTAGCMKQNKTLHLELVTYYKVFDLSPVPRSKIRWAAVALPVTVCSDFSYGDSVLVSFYAEGDKLLPHEIGEIPKGLSGAFSLIGEYVGSPADDSLCFVGFPFQVSQEDYEATEYSKGATLLVDVTFAAKSNSELVFKSMVIIDRQNKEPMRFK